MSNRNYVYPAKTLSQSRSKFKMPHTIKTSFLHGDCVPFHCYEVLPGDTFKLNIASLIRMSTPIAPIMDNITMHLAAYFVPCRLVFDNWEQLMGANKSGAWTADDNTYNVPSCSIAGGTAVHTIGDYLGITPTGGIASGIKANCLPGRAYYLIWNEFYRNQNVTAPLAIDHTSVDRILVDNGDLYNHACCKLGKYSDYFTKCLPEPQKHDPISIIPDDISVGIYGAANDLSSEILTISSSDLIFDGGEDYSSIYRLEGSSSDGFDQDSLVANTSGQAWNNINALRFAFQLQKFYEKDARYGTRYFEMLNGHFGVTNPDLVLNRPQFLGEINFRINVDQVLSTAGYSASSSTTVGAPGANSVTGNKGSLFTGSFTEHGYIIIVGGCRHDQTYGQGMQKLFTRKDRLDFYDPVFANIGEQPVMQSEIRVAPDFNGSSTMTDSVFGYQEAWAEYRFIPDKVSGILAPWRANSLDFWTLSNLFTSKVLLNDSFIYENRSALSRALVTGETGPDYIADFYFDLTVTREMPLFSIPGLADHH